jgi:hypothetical protein
MFQDHALEAPRRLEQRGLHLLTAPAITYRAAGKGLAGNAEVVDRPGMGWISAPVMTAMPRQRSSALP